MRPPAFNPEMVQPLIVQGVAEEIENAPTFVSVKAPTNLPGGYKFDASLNVGNETKIVKITVPEEGVKAGETIIVPLLPVIDAPIGEWKDGVFDCFKYGFCHPSCLCAFFCKELGMAQIMTRMSLDCFGSSGTREKTKNTFKIILVLFILYEIILSLSAMVAPIGIYKSVPNFYHLLVGMVEQAHNEWTNVSPPRREYYYIVIAGFLLGLFFLIALIRTRQAVRDHYSIPGGCCEDVVCSTCCGCCVIAQMARHTGDYENNEAVCCSDRGLSKKAPCNV